MFKKILLLCTFIFNISSCVCIITASKNKILLNGEFINKDTPTEGLLINSRMIQGISDGFDKWPYPDTNKWNATRNNEEFINNMYLWKSKGLNGFTVGMQGGAPKSGATGYKNSAFNGDGTLKSSYMGRLRKILNKANDLNMIVIISMFYRTQVNIFGTYNNAYTGAKNLLMWLKNNNYSNVIIEPVNECEFSEFSSVGLSCSQNVPELIKLARSYGFLSGNSLKGGKVPSSAIIDASSVILIHGNSLSSNSKYKTMIDGVKKSSKYRGQPIIINEASTSSGFLDYCISQGVGWGYYDQGSNNYQDGYQSPPINWSINTSKKKSFFDRASKYIPN